MSDPDSVTFEGYEIDRAKWQLRYGEEALPLNRKTFDLLLYLVDHAGRVVTKEELLRALWPGAFIEESNLTQQVFLLRKALSKHPSGKKIIETTPGRGYQFAVPVHTATGPQPDPSFAPVPNDQGTSKAGELAIASAPTRLGSGPQNPERGADQSQDDAGPHPPADPVAGAVPRPTPDRLSRSRWLWASVVAAGLLMATYLVLKARDAPRISVTNYAQITHDGHAKSLGGTDGSRLYFTRLEKSSVAQVSISGGADALLPLAIQDPWSGDVSPDGSELLIISQAGGQGPASSLWTLQLVNGYLHRLGNAIAAAWSPDGAHLVCASAKGELIVMRHDGSEAHRIASMGGNIKSPAWSPDGQVIRFTRDGLLWQISPDGHNLRQVLPGWGKEPTQWSGRWAANGDFFIAADGQLWVLTNGTGPFRRASPVPVQLTYGPTVWDHPVPSSDGKKIYASGRTSHGDLVRFEPDLGLPKPFLDGISAEFVTYSKSGNVVAYVSYPQGVLWRANVDGGHPVQLTEPPLYPKSICWSPDGTQLAFVDRTGDNVSAIFVTSTSAPGSARRLLPDDRNPETDPSWSPDGRKLAFSTGANVGASGASDLRVLDLASGRLAALPGSEGLLVPRWSPDGKTIAAMTLNANGLRVLNLAQGTWSSLPTGAVAFPEWSHDSQWIYYVRWTTDPALVRIRAADGRQETVASLRGQHYTGTYTLWMGLDPADKPMMLRDAGTDDIYALTLQRR